MIYRKTVLQTSVLLAVLMAPFTPSFAQPQKEDMKITNQQEAPDFTLQTVEGTSVCLTDYRGKKVLLTFYRNVGCPICNFRFHELEQEARYFKSKGLVVIAVYESSAENMKRYLAGTTPYAIMLPNPAQDIYRRYGVERSMGKIMKGMLHGAMGKARKGKKLFLNNMKQDGHADRIGADFLIDEQGRVYEAHYGRYVSDHIPVESIKAFLNRP